MTFAVIHVLSISRGVINGPHDHQTPRLIKCCCGWSCSIVLNTFRTGCFLPDTQVTTSLDGSASVPIQNIQSGQEVLVFNTTTGKQEMAKVAKLLSFQVNETVVICLSDGSSIRTTSSHPIFEVTSQSWAAVDPAESTGILSCALTYFPQPSRVAHTS